MRPVAKTLKVPPSAALVPLEEAFDRRSRTGGAADERDPVLRARQQFESLVFDAAARWSAAASFEKSNPALSSAVAAR